MSLISSTYYELLNRVRREGDWEEWIDFFLEGVHLTAENAVSTADRLQTLFREDRARIEGLGGRSGSALRVHDALKSGPIVPLTKVSRLTGLSFPAVSRGMTQLVDLGIARELTGRRRGRLFAYDRYLATLTEGTDPL